MAYSPIEDVGKLREMWGRGVSVEQIALHFGCSEPAVRHARKKLGLPQRPRVPSRIEAEIAVTRFDPGPILARVEKARSEGRIATPPFWTWDRDRAVIEAGGRWQKVALLAARWRMTSAQIIARWHVLRAV